MNRNKALKLLRENLYLVSTLTAPPMVMDLDQLFIEENNEQFPWDEMGLMVTLSGKEAYELAKELCPKRRQLLLPGGDFQIIQEDEPPQILVDKG